jgi:hypothetical protein
VAVFVWSQLRQCFNLHSHITPLAGTGKSAQTINTQEFPPLLYQELVQSLMQKLKQSFDKNECGDLLNNMPTNIDSVNEHSDERLYCCDTMGVACRSAAMYFHRNVKVISLLPPPLLTTHMPLRNATLLPLPLPSHSVAAAVSCAGVFAPWLELCVWQSTEIIKLEGEVLLTWVSVSLWNLASHMSGQHVTTIASLLGPTSSPSEQVGATNATLSPAERMSVLTMLSWLQRIVQACLDSGAIDGATIASDMPSPTFLCTLALGARAAVSLLHGSCDPDGGAPLSEATVNSIPLPPLSSVPALFRQLSELQIEPTVEEQCATCQCAVPLFQRLPEGNSMAGKTEWQLSDTCPAGHAVHRCSYSMRIISSPLVLNCRSCGRQVRNRGMRSTKGYLVHTVWLILFISCYYLTGSG